MDIILRYVKGTLWSLLELIVYLFFIVLIAGSLGFLSLKLTGENVLDESDMFNRPYMMLLLEYAPLLIGSIASLYITHTLIFKKNFVLTGFSYKNIYKEIGQGGLLALLMLSIGFILLYSLEMIAIEKIDFNPFLFIGFLLFFFVQSSFEEVVTRAFMIPSISSRINVPIALLISSSIFAILHLSNPNINWISLSNIFLAGLLMGLLFLKTNRIWAPIGLHAFWNFLQGSFFGFEVSGFDVYSLIDSKEIGADLWTGGQFGFEGSLIALLLLLVSCIYIIYHNPSIIFNNRRFNTENTAPTIS